jgi:hypothetical protein
MTPRALLDHRWQHHPVQAHDRKQIEIEFVLTLVIGRSAASE